MLLLLKKIKVEILKSMQKQTSGTYTNGAATILKLR